MFGTHLQFRHSTVTFFTGVDKEPLLGFRMKPTIQFVPAVDEFHFLPTANTCINKLTLPTGMVDIELLSDLFIKYDVAFQNNHFGLI